MTDREQAARVIEDAMEELAGLELSPSCVRYLDAALSCLNGALEQLQQEK